jgi:ABC-type ATPase involved in cell division
LSVRHAEERARAALARVGLDESDARPRELSGGQQQRAALARAIVNRPALVLVDEPTAHLDRDAAGALLKLLEQFAIGGVTVLLASHDEAALPRRARRIRLHDGRVAADVPPLTYLSPA